MSSFHKCLLRVRSIIIYIYIYICVCVSKKDELENMKINMPLECLNDLSVTDLAVSDL